MCLKIPTDSCGNNAPISGYQSMGNRLVTRSFTAFNPRWHPSSEEIQKSPPSGLPTKGRLPLSNPRHSPGLPPSRLTLGSLSNDDSEGYENVT